MPTLMSNRIAKAERFAAFLTEHLGEKATPANVGQFTTDQWLHIAALAGEGLPSPATRRLIVHELGR